jgi:hypothetical protein
MEIDNQVVDSVRNFLFGQPGQGGFDLASLNIQRGRDHGLADYNSTRAALGLPRVTSFSQITSDPVLASKLKQLYGNVNDVDLWVGGLAEDHARGSNLGPTFQHIVVDQFTRTRDGDRFWFERDLTGSDLTMVRNTTLRDAIDRNTHTSNLQGDVFHFSVGVTGTIFRDSNGNGRQDFREAGVSGLTVQLLDSSGNVIDTARTGSDGAYSFLVNDLGSFTVKPLLPAGLTFTTASSKTVSATRGTTITGVNFGVRNTFASAQPSSSAQVFSDPASTNDRNTLADVLTSSTV